MEAMLDGSPVLLWARSAWRERWSVAVLLAVLAAATSALCLVAVTGAVRSPDAFERLRRATNASDIHGFIEPDDVSPADIERVAGAQPDVLAFGIQAEPFLSPDFDRYIPTFNVMPVATITSSDASAIDVPLVVAGRPADPARVDQMTVSERFADELDLDAGDTLRLESVTDEWVDVAFSGGDLAPPDGPSFEMTVTGIVRTPVDRGHFSGAMFFTPALMREYQGRFRTNTYFSARITDPDTMTPERQAELGAAFAPLSEELNFSYSSDQGQLDGGLSAISDVWWIIAGIALLAGGAVCFQVARTTARQMLSDHTKMDALGATRRQLLGGTMIVIGVPAAIGVAMGVALGVVASPRALAGLARAVEPNPDRIVFEPWVLTVCLAVLMLAMATVAVAASWRPGRRSPARRAPVRGWPPVARPVGPSIGVRSALAPASLGAGRTTIVLTAIAIAGMTASLSVVGSIGRLDRDPSLSGGVTSRVIDSGESTERLDAVLPVALADPRIERAVSTHIFFPAVGETTAVAVATDNHRGTFEYSILRGRWTGLAERGRGRPGDVAAPRCRYRRRADLHRCGRVRTGDVRDRGGKPLPAR